MATLINADDFIERFDVSKDIEAPRITPAIGSAARRLRQWITADVYAATVDILGIDEGDRSDDQAEQLADLQNAEAHLAYHFAIAGFNSPLSSKGVVSTARTSEGREMRVYLNPDQTAALSLQMLELAREIADRYITFTDESGVRVVRAACE